MATILPLHKDKMNGTTSIVEYNEFCYPIGEGTMYGTLKLTSEVVVEKKKGLLTIYSDLLEKSPVPTKMITIAVINFLSDVVAQMMKGSSIFSLDFYESTRLSLIGAVFTAPLYHTVYEILEKKFPISINKNNRFIHLAVDQLVIIPLWTVCFVTFISLLEGIWTIMGINEQLHSQMFNIIISSWLIYPILQYLNFTYVPSKMRIIVLNSVGFFFTIIVSFISNGSPKVETVGHLIKIPYT